MLLSDLSSKLIWFYINNSFRTYFHLIFCNLTIFRGIFDEDQLQFFFKLLLSFINFTIHLSFQVEFIKLQVRLLIQLRPMPPSHQKLLLLLTLIVDYIKDYIN
jgi:hypothetical protein